MQEMLDEEVPYAGHYGRGYGFSDEGAYLPPRVLLSHGGDRRLVGIPERRPAAESKLAGP